jgi:hypothetical protein
MPVKTIIEEFSFTDLAIQDPNGKAKMWITRSYIPIILGYNHKIPYKVPIACLLDSGCDHNLFPGPWAKLIGIKKLESGEKIDYTGIGSSGVVAYRHFVNLIIPNSKISFKTQVDFSNDQQTPLLGRTGFFCYFKKVIFDEVNNKLILEL